MRIRRNDLGRRKLKRRLNEIGGRFHVDEFGVYVLLAESHPKVVVEYAEFPPILADLRNVAKRIDVAMDQRIADESLRQTFSVGRLAEQIQFARHAPL